MNFAEGGAVQQDLGYDFQSCMQSANARFVYPTKEDQCRDNKYVAEEGTKILAQCSVEIAHEPHTWWAAIGRAFAEIFTAAFITNPLNTDYAERQAACHKRWGDGFVIN